MESQLKIRLFEGPELFEYELTFPSWKTAYQYINYDKFSYEILDRSKLCRILRSWNRRRNDFSHIYFLVDLNSCTVKQAIASTKLGCILLTHFE
jgi:hypothetical protein